MNYCTISHTSKKVNFRSGRKANEFYYHTKSKNLIVNLAEEFNCVKKLKEQIEVSGIGADFLNICMNYSNISWDTLLGWKNYTLRDLCTDILKEIAAVNHPESMGEGYDRWAASIKSDGLYLNIRIYEEIK